MFNFICYVSTPKRATRDTVENYLHETLESDTIRAVKLLWSSFSSPFRVDFCLLKTVPSTLSCRQRFNTNKRERNSKHGIFIYCPSTESVISQQTSICNISYSGALCMMLWTNNWISVNLRRHWTLLMTWSLPMTLLVFFRVHCVWDKLLESSDSLWVILKRWPTLNE